MTDIKVPLDMSPSNSNDAPQENAAKQNPTVAEEEAAKKAALEAELDEEYIDKRFIIIASVLNYSAYRRMNMAAIGKPRNMIGSSVNSVRKLMSNKGEVEHYFPELVGVASNNPEFITRVKNYLNNMFLDIRDTERKIDISFRYHHKRDYLKIKAAEDRIWAKYNEVDRSNAAKLYEAAVMRDNDLFNLESTNMVTLLILSNILFIVIVLIILMLLKMKLSSIVMLIFVSTLKMYVKKRLVRRNLLRNNKLP